MPLFKLLEVLKSNGLTLHMRSVHPELIDYAHRPMTWLLGNVPEGNLLLTLLKTPAWLRGHRLRHTPRSSWGWCSCHWLIYAATPVFKEAQECDQLDTQGSYLSHWQEQWPQKELQTSACGTNCSLFQKVNSKRAVQQDALALPFSLFLTSPARRVTHSRWHVTGGGVTCRGTRLCARRNRAVHSGIKSCSRVRDGVTHSVPTPGSDT